MCHVLDYVVRRGSCFRVQGKEYCIFHNTGKAIAHVLGEGVRNKSS